MLWNGSCRQGAFGAIPLLWWLWKRVRQLHSRPTGLLQPSDGTCEGRTSHQLGHFQTCSKIILFSKIRIARRLIQSDIHNQICNVLRWIQTTSLHPEVIFIGCQKKSDRSHLWIHEKTRPLCNEILISVARCWSENSVESLGRNPWGTMSWMLTKHLTQDTITVRTLDL